MKGANIRTSVRITFEEAVFGVEKEIELTLKDECTACHGTGAKPGTSPETTRFSSFPSRRTRACGADIRFSASMAFSARLSWMAPISALHTTMNRIISGSGDSPSPCQNSTAADTTAATSRMRIIKSANCRRNRRRKDSFFCPSSSFGPHFSNRSLTCRLESPLF